MRVTAATQDVAALVISLIISGLVLIAAILVFYWTVSQPVWPERTNRQVPAAPVRDDDTPLVIEHIARE